MYKTEKSVDMENTPDSAQKIELKQPSEIYKQIKKELEKIISNLQKNPLGEGNTNSTDLEKSDIEKLRKQSTQALTLLQSTQALTLLEKQKEELDKQLDELDKNAEWDTFTIAFYGETGAGKSTLIETLRILLKEPTKVKQQQAFQQAEKACLSAEASLQELKKALEKAKEAVNKLENRQTAELQIHDEKHSQALSAVTELQKKITQRQNTANLWQKVLHLFKKWEEEIQLPSAQNALQVIADARDATSAKFDAELSETLQKKEATEQQIKALQPDLNNRLKALDALSDGAIIGDGRSDFTRETQRYDFNINGKAFALLDVPGIEGKEDTVSRQILQALQKAHAVFYVTNRAAAPQTGDNNQAGTLEKIKDHLGAQTDVWAVYNKKLTNAERHLKNRPLINTDEESGLKELGEKMREKLGEHYRDVFPLTALQAFLASTENLPSSSQHASRRKKSLQAFDAQELIQKSQVHDLIRLLHTELLENSGYKIWRSNVNKAYIHLQNTLVNLDDLDKSFEGIHKKLERSGNSAQIQLGSSIKTLKSKLEGSNEKLANQFKNTVREKVYKLIDSDLKDKEVENALKKSINNGLSELERNIPEEANKNIEMFQESIEGIYRQFESQTTEVVGTLSNKLSSFQFAKGLNITIDIPSGVSWLGVAVSIASGIAALVPGPGWIYAAISATGILLSLGKAVWKRFDSDYKKSQQRKAVDEQLRKVTEQIREKLQNKTNEAVQYVNESTATLEKTFLEPAKQALATHNTLNNSLNHLQILSLQIKNSGDL